MRNIEVKVGAPDFNWDIYSNGYNGKSLAINYDVEVSNKKDKVFSHESYAQSMYKQYFNSNSTFNPKDVIKGAVQEVVDIRVSNGSEILVDTNGGCTLCIDLNKEKKYIHHFGINEVEDFIASINNPVNKKIIMDTIPMIKILNEGRASLWEGHIASLEDEFRNEISNPQNAYYATITSSNKGGYIVDINGITCFMPGSMAAAGIIADFESMIGRVVPVMIVNYIDGAGFVVSYKKYLSKVLPYKINKELEIDQRVICNVTGISKNGIYLIFNDINNEPVFTGLLHRDEMTPLFEMDFDNNEIKKGDTIPAFIHSIYIDGEKIRIVLGDTDMSNYDYIIKKDKLEKNKKNNNGKHRY